jgi:hypothetical protein
VRLGGAQEKKQGVLVDRSVVAAAGVAVSSVEKLGPEISAFLFCGLWLSLIGVRVARHFERDPTTGEVLWFPGPPMHVARAPPPRHRLEYLHFLAKKYRPDLEVVTTKPEPEVIEKANVNGNGNGNGNGLVNGERGDDSMGSDDARAQSIEVEMGPAAPKEGDVEMGELEVPPAKRQKIEETPERYISASERIREVLTRGVVEVG